MNPRRRSRLRGAGLLLATIVLGLSSRRFAGVLPGVVADYAGDTLWALALFLSIGLLLPRLETGWVAALALSGSLLVELSQLYHAPWIDAVRQTTIGGLVLGFGFLWSDLACYAVGVSLGVAFECLALRSRGR